MINILDKAEIIKLKQRGKSYRYIAKTTGLHRSTITDVCKEHFDNIDKLNLSSNIDEIKTIQDNILLSPSYDSSSRKKVKYTDEIDLFIDNILEDEKIKDSRLGATHKQKITNQIIHQSLLEHGFDIGITTITNMVKLKRQKFKETFIRQSYDLGQRLEFDFGEVNLIIDGIKTKLHLAVFSSPAANFRYAYLYDNQGKKVFQDAHVRFFEDIGGIYTEVVYDNMRNVVSKFIGRSEKILNEDLIKLSMYYGFEINTTNCFKGNEKGHVEGSVKIIRNNTFTLKYEFNSIDEARNHLKNCLDKLNEKSSIEQEKKALLPARPKLEISELLKLKVNKYSVIRVDNNFYSVPEDLNGKEVIVKNYINDIEVFYKENYITKHTKLNGFLEYKIDILHFLKTFKSKPNALKNSQALANNSQLKSIYDNHYKDNPRLFIELISQNKHLSVDGLNEILLTNYNSSIKVEQLEDRIINESKKQLSLYTSILKGEKHGNN